MTKKIEEQNLFEHFCNHISAEILIQLSEEDKNRIDDIETRSRYNYITNKVKQLQQRNLLEATKHGRSKKLELTNKGERLSAALQNLKQVCLKKP